MIRWKIGKIFSIRLRNGKYALLQMAWGNSGVIVFDEFIVNSHWENDEYRAFLEFCDANGYAFKVDAVSLFTKQVICRIKS